VKDITIYTLKKVRKYPVRGSLVRNVLNLRNNLSILDILQLVVTLQGICASTKVSAIDSSSYYIECYDLAGNESMEISITVYNPALKGFLIRLIGAIQSYQKEREKGNQQA